MGQFHPATSERPRGKVRVRSRVRAAVIDHHDDNPPGGLKIPPVSAVMSTSWSIMV
jgi:hypothetical protein